MPLKKTASAAVADDKSEERATALGAFLAGQCKRLLSSTKNDLRFSSEELVAAGVVLARSALEKLYENGSLTVRGFVGGLLSNGSVESLGEKVYSLLESGGIAGPEESSAGSNSDSNIGNGGFDE